MPDPDRDAEPERPTDPRFDNWPVQRYEAHERWPVERATPERGSGESNDLEWLGTAGTADTGAYVYEPATGDIHRGRFDDENQRIVVDEDEAGHREVGEDETLGDHLVDVGDEHGWTWLSSFAHDHLETHGSERGPEHDHERERDERTGNRRLPPGFDHQYAKFQRRNLAESADVDAAFHGTHTFADGTGRVHVLEREFGVDAEESAGATVTVKERYLIAEEPLEETREGDAELVDRREYEFTADADTTERDWLRGLESDLQQWHEANLAPPLRAGEER